jgi:hypothetical protein
MRRQYAFLITSAILMFIIVIIPLIVDAPYTSSHHSSVIRTPAESYAMIFSDGIYRSEVQAYFIMVILCFLSFASALSASRYMHSMKMTDLYHSLPIRREKLLLTNAASSMTAVLGPFAAVYILVMLWQMIFFGHHGWLGGWYFSFAFMDFMTIAIAVFVVYAFTTLIAVNVGTTFDAMAISGVVGFMPTILWLIAGSIGEAFSYGYSFHGDNIIRVSPFLFFYERAVAASQPWYSSYDGFALVFVIWLLVGAAFFAGAIYLYRRRKSELAEQTQPGGVLQTAVKCFAAYIGSAVFLMIFDGEGFPLWVQVFVIIAAAVGIGLIAELILSRGVKFIKKNIKVLAITGAIYAVLFLGLYFDLFGVVSRVPPLNSIESVQINYRGRFANESFSRYQSESDRMALTSPESVSIVRDTHRAIINDYNERKRGRQSIYNDHSYYLGSGQVTITYNLKGGGTLTRSYRSVSSETYLILAGLEDKEDFIMTRHPIFWLDYFERQPGQFRVDVSVENISGGITPLNLREEQALLLVNAIRRDLISQPLDSIFNGEPVYSYLRLDFVSHLRSADPCLFPLTRSYAQTLSLLREFGYQDLIQPEITEIRMIRMERHVFSENRVASIKPDDRHRFAHRFNTWYSDDDIEYYYDNPSFFAIRDQNEIAALLQAGRGSLLFTSETHNQYLLMGLYSQGGMLESVQFAAFEDLPLPVLRKFTQHAW